MGNNYKTYKYIKNSADLKKYDPGATPIDFQMGEYHIPTGTIDDKRVQLENPYKAQGMAEVASAVPQFMELGKNFADTLKAAGTYKTAAASSIPAVSKVTVASPGMSAVTAAGKVNPGLSVSAAEAGSSSGSSLSAASNANLAIAIPMAVYGGVKTFANAEKFGTSPFTTDDLLQSAGTYTTPEGAKQIGSLDWNRFSTTLRDYNNAGTASTISSASTFGGGAGTILGTAVGGPVGGVVGGLVGTGIGAFGGWVTRLINRGKAKRKANQLAWDFNSATRGFNRQSWASQISRNMQDKYYQQHAVGADKGLDEGEEPNALVNNREVLGTVKNGRIKQAYTVDSNLPDRYDGIPANIGPNDFVIGHKIGPDGVELNEKAQLYERMFNSNDPRLQKIGENGLLATLKTQKHTPDNNPNPWDILTADKGKNMRKYNCGKNLAKYDLGDPYDGYRALKDSQIFNAFGAMIPSLASYHLWKEDQKPVYVPRTDVDDSSQMRIVNSMPTQTNINPTLEEILNLNRYYSHSINQNGSLTDGQKMLLRSQANSDRMKALVDAYAKKYELDNQLKLNKTNAAINVTGNSLNRQFQANTDWAKRYATATGAKHLNTRQDFTGIFTPFSSMLENFHNNAWQRAMMNLYAQRLTQQQKDSLKGGG